MSISRKRHSIIFLLLVCLSSTCLFGQTKVNLGSQFINNGQPTLKAYEKAARKAFHKKDYYAALTYYKEALRLDKTKVENHYQYAQSARLFGADLIARDAYAQVVKMDTLNHFPKAAYYYGVAEKKLGNYESAELIVNEIKLPELEELTAKERLDFEYIFAQKPDLALGEVEVLCLDSTINTIYSEVSPVWRNGELYYASLRYNKIEQEIVPPRKFAKMLHSNLATDGVVWEAVTIPNKTTAHFTFTPDDSRMYFSVCDYREEEDRNAEMHCKLYYRDKIGDDWGVATSLPNSINLPNYTTTQPAIGLDAAGNEVLYFVSNRPEGKGGLDIWYTEIIGENEFGTPKNFKTNTDENDITPFFHYRTNALYFSSEGHLGYGGYDVYKVHRMEDERWTSINYLSAPINTSYNDFNYILVEEGVRGFLVSNRENCILLEDLEWACNDIFLVNHGTPPEEPCTSDIILTVFEAEDKLPLTDALVVLNDGENEHHLEQANEAGHYVFTDNLVEANYTITVSAAGYETNRITATKTACQPIEAAIDLTTICVPKLTITVLDDETETVLRNATIQIQEGDKNYSLQAPNVADAYIFRQLFTAPEHTITVLAEGYQPLELSCNRLEDCDELELRMRMYKEIPPPCEPILTVKIYDEKTEKPVPNVTVNLVPVNEEPPTAYEGTDANPSGQTTYSNEFVFSIDTSIAYYRVVVQHIDYEPAEVTVYPYDCQDIGIPIKLKQKPKTEFPNLLPIVCYFENDVPKKERNAPQTFSSQPFDALYQRYHPRNGYYQRRFAAGKTGYERENALEEVNDFFVKEVMAEFDKLEKFKDTLYQRLQQGEYFVLSIRGYASNLAASDYNKKLGSRRVWSVKNYFIATWGDRFLPYVESTQLILNEIPIGEVGTGYDDPNDRQNSVYNPISARQRKAQIERVDHQNNAQLRTGGK